MFKFCFCILIAVLFKLNCNAIEYPAPPMPPKRFDNPEEILNFMTKWRNYNLVVGRPRFVLKRFPNIKY
jgi:hypothetical protein